MHDFSCTAHSTPSPTTPFPCSVHLRAGRNGERPFNCGRKFTTGEGAPTFTESSKWCQSLLVMWLVILAGRGGAGWAEALLKETEEVNLQCHCKAALQGEPITYPASWRLQGRAPWGETKERRGGWQWKDLGSSFSVQVSTNLVMSSRAGWQETALQSTGAPAHFVCLSLFSEGSFVLMARQVCVPSLCWMSTHISQTVRSGKKCCSSWRWKVFFINSFLGFC